MKLEPPFHLTHLTNRLGWKLECGQNLPVVLQAMEQRQRIGVYQDAGRRDWWRPLENRPDNFVELNAWPVPSDQPLAAIIGMSDRILAPETRLQAFTILYRPRTLTLGLDGPTDAFGDDLSDLLEGWFARQGLCLASLTAAATSRECPESPDLIDFCEELGIPLLVYPPDKLAWWNDHRLVSQAQDGHSEKREVSELAAALAAGTNTCVVPATDLGSWRVAVARRATG